jgi:hypothetical protein
MKKVIWLLIALAFITCQSITSSPEDAGGNGTYEIIGAGFDGGTVYICIKNVSNTDINLKSCTMNIYKDESTTVSTNVAIGTIKAGHCTFVRVGNYNSNYDFSYSIKEK